MSQLPFERIWRASPRASILVEANRVIASSDAARRLLGDALEGREVLTLFDDDGIGFADHVARFGQVKMAAG